MGPVSDAIATVWADARRAAAPGSIGDRPDRAGEIVGEPIAPSDPRSFAPSASPLSVALDGPGWFVLEQRGSIVYGRLGDLRVDRTGAIVDGGGRAVLGRATDAGGSPRGEIKPIVVGDGHGSNNEVRIDANGIVNVRSHGRSSAVARLVVALFPASGRLARASESTVTRTREAGEPTVTYPGEPNVGTVRAHRLELGMVDLSGDLAALWRLGRRMDYAATSAYAADRCTQAALGLVK